MEGPRWHSTRRLIAPAVALLLIAATIAGLRPEMARADDDGVTIYIAVSETSPGSSGDSPSDGPGGSGGWSCSADVMNIGVGMREWFEREAPLHPGQAPWIVRCDNGFFGVVWLSTDVGPTDIQIVVVQGDAVDPAAMAAALLDHVPVPDITIGPSSRLTPWAA
jgi:hypothetical protein